MVQASSLMSDLHLEKGASYWSFKIERTAPYLILAGDIGQLRHHEGHLAFLRAHCNIFERMFLVLGNHEFYGISRQEGIEYATRFEEELREKLVVMNRTKQDIEDGNIVILGCTLLPRIPEDTEGLTNDFQCIQQWCVSDHNEEYHKDLEWLKQSLEVVLRSKQRSRVIIVTHYAPPFDQTTHPTHRSSRNRYCFCSDTLTYLDTKVALEHVTHWIFGHTHYNGPPS